MKRRLFISGFLKINKIVNDTDLKMLTRQGWKLYKVYIDRCSSLSPLEEKKELTQLFEDSRKELFSHIVIFSLDRFGKTTENI